MTKAAPGVASELGPPIGIGRTAEVFAAGPDRVVKLLRARYPRAAAEDEARVAILAASVYAAAPRCDGVVEIEGRPGIVYERVEGPSMDARVRSRPWETDRLARLLGTLHAEMHAAAMVPVDGQGLPDQREVLQSAIARAESWLTASSASAAHARIDRLPIGSSLCHGDLHPANVLLGRRAVVIDWDNARCGSPAADVARSVFLIRDAAMLDLPNPALRLLLGPIRRRFASGYLAAYRARQPLDLGQVAAWRLPILAARLAEGIAEEREPLLAEIEREVAR